jgi:hypothetical protein
MNFELISFETDKNSLLKKDFFYDSNMRKGGSMITMVYGSILRPSSNNWASYRRLKWQIAALFL